MSIHDWAALQFVKWGEWVTYHEQPSCDECRAFIAHCDCIVRGQED